MMNKRQLASRLPVGVLRFLYAGWSLKMLTHQFPLADSAGGISCRPLFIISPGRSGTTLLRSMLVAGGEIAIPPESYVIGPTIMKYAALNLEWADMARLSVAQFESNKEFYTWETDLSHAYEVTINLPNKHRSVARIIDEVFGCYRNQNFTDAQGWGDQSPMNTFFLTWIDRTFPDAKYIHMLRDGRDVVASCFEMGYELEQAVMRWNTGVQESLKHSRRVAEDCFLEVRYEELVQNPESTLHDVCEFIGIRYSERMLDFWRLPSTIEQRYYNHHRNIAKPISAHSVGRWSERLDAEQQDYVVDGTDALLRLLGYVR